MPFSANIDQKVRVPLLEHKNHLLHTGSMGFLLQILVPDHVMAGVPIAAHTLSPPHDLALVPRPQLLECLLPFQSHPGALQQMFPGT